MYIWGQKIYYLCSLGLIEPLKDILVYTDRMKAYIEAHDENQDNFSIMIHFANILIGKVDLDHQLPWLYTVTNDDGDLVINNSAGMEANKWDHITHEIIGMEKEHTWKI